MNDAAHSPTSWPSAILAATAVAVTQTAVAVSLASLVFTGTSAPHFVRGGAAFLLTLAISNLVVSWRSSVRSVVTGIPNTSAILVASAFLGIAESDATPANLFVFLAILSLTVGASYFALGKVGGGQVIRFLPRPVLTAYLGGVGWLLVQGGIGSMRHKNTTILSLATQDFWNDFLLWGSGLAITVLMSVGVFKKWPPLVQSGIVVGALALFFVVSLANTSLADLRTSRWVIGAPDQSATWTPISPAELKAVDIGFLADGLPTILGSVLLALAGHLLNVSGISIAQKERIEGDKELQTVGIANIVSAPFGGLITHYVAGLTEVGMSLAVAGKKFALSLAAVLVTVAFVAQDWLALMPRPVAGAVLANLGVALAIRWWQEGILRASKIDRVLGIVIVATMVTFGVLPGIFAGVVAATVMFVVRYSRIGPIKQQLDGGTFHSNVDRRRPEKELLATHQSATLVLILHGYLFFGSVKQLEDVLYQRINDRAQQKLEYLVLQFRDVSGVDASAVSAFEAVNRLAQRYDVNVVWSGADAWASPLGTQVVKQPDLDHAMAWCEDGLLKTYGSELPPNKMGTSSKALEAIFSAYGTKRHIEAGDVLIRSGDQDNTSFFVSEGQLTSWLERDGQFLARFQTVSAGSLIGEVALAAGKPRSATVRADTDATVWELSADSTTRMAREDPAKSAELNSLIVQRIAERLTATNQTVAELLQDR